MIKKNLFKKLKSKYAQCLSSLFFILILLLSSHSYAQGDGEPYRIGKYKSRISVGAVKSFYKNNTQMTSGTKALFGYCVSYKGELFLLRRTNIIIGAEYFNHGFTFHGYYEKPGFTYLYDQTFPYTHEVRIQELHIPLSLKVSFNSEKENAYSTYFIGGIGARYIFSSYTVITNDSTGFTPYDAKDDIDFENQRLMKGLNAFYQVGLGLQHNHRDSGRAFIFEVSYKYGISRYHYDGDSKSNNLNIKGGFLTFSIGFRV